MTTVRDVRHANLLDLIEEAGSVQALATRLEKSHAQISQLRNQAVHSGTKKPRTVGDDLAREIETKLKKPVGWMDHPHKKGQGLPVQGVGDLSPRAASLAARMDTLTGNRQALAFALVDQTLQTLEADEEAARSPSTKRRSRDA